MRSERILELDILRAIAIILIVFAHFPPLSFISIDPTIKYWSAIIGVSMFLFISGMVLRHPNDVKAFYKRRALRIYPAYLLILAVYIAIQYGLPDTANTLGIYLSPYEILVNVIGLQAWFNVASYGVLWFVGLILIYYLIYPLLGPQLLKTVIGSIAVFAVFVVLHLTTDLIIPQMIYYFPIFVAGILVSKINYRSRLHESRNIAPLLFIASVSYAIYLTHQLILTTLSLLMSCIQTDALLILIGIPAILLTSYVIIKSTTKITAIAIAAILVIGVVAATHPGSTNVAPTSTISPTTKNATKNVTVVKHNATKHYILYYLHNSAECPQGLAMNAKVTTWAQGKSRVEFQSLPLDDALMAKYNVRISPTTILIDKATGQIVKEWIGQFDVSELTTIYNS